MRHSGLIGFAALALLCGSSSAQAACGKNSSGAGAGQCNPLRGGVTIQAVNGYGTCTAGYTVASGGTRYMLTAGHCLAGGITEWREPAGSIDGFCEGLRSVAWRLDTIDAGLLTTGNCTAEDWVEAWNNPWIITSPFQNPTTTTPHWYGQAGRIGTLLVMGWGVLTLENAKLGAITCESLIGGDIANPTTGGAGTGIFDNIDLYDCAAPVCEALGGLERASPEGLKWSSMLSEALGVFSDRIEGVALWAQCTASSAELFRGSLSPTFHNGTSQGSAPALLVINASSGGLESRQGEGTITAHLNLMGYEAGEIIGARSEYTGPPEDWINPKVNPASPYEGEEVCLYGHEEDHSCGKVFRTNQSIACVDGVQRDHMFEVAVKSNPGDSGGAIDARVKGGAANREAKAVGILVCNGWGQELPPVLSALGVSLP